MRMNASEAELTELEPERFEFTKSFNAAIDVRLLSETVVSTFGVKFHGYPVVSCVMGWLFKASAIFNFHSNEFLLSHLYRAGECLPRATKNRYGLTGEKEMRLFICGSYADASDRAVFPAATNNFITTIPFKNVSLKPCFSSKKYIVRILLFSSF